MIEQTTQGDSSENESKRSKTIGTQNSKKKRVKRSVFIDVYMFIVSPIQSLLISLVTPIQPVSVSQRQQRSTDHCSVGE